MNIETMRKLALGAALLALGACSTVTGGTSQDITIMSNPSGASCELEQNETQVGRVTSTPQRVRVDRSKHDLFVTCGKPGYLTEKASARSSLRGATLGNILLGGVIGIGIDMASGANNDYPDEMTVHLTPAQFPSAQARDDYFAAEAARINAEADAAAAGARDLCTTRRSGPRTGSQSNQAKNCDDVTAEIEANRAAQLQALEAKRAQSSIR